MMCALLKTVLLNASVMAVITDVCDALIYLCLWNHSHFIKIDCFFFFFFLIAKYIHLLIPLGG